jgi:glycosyltransferase involved in cell wall biosynthesis
MVVIPARNEAGRIARAVKSFPHDTVIVVDDDSQDQTAAEAREAGAGVLKAPPLPQGAFGKSHACQAAAGALTSRWMLFADADTWYEPEFLNRVVASAESGGLDFLSVQPTLQPESFVENLLAPYAAALFFCAVNPKARPSAAFNGQCILARREAYWFIGGHAVLRKHLADDLHWALRAERHRMRFAVARAGPLGHTRFHPGGIREGLLRNASRLLEAGWLPGAVLMLAALLAALWLPAAAALWIPGERSAAFAVAALPLFWLAGWYRSWRLILAPFAIYAILPMLCRAALAALRGSSIAWKGRTI